jgi:hypothetical protein
MQAKDAHFRNPPKASLLRKKEGGTKKKGASSGQIQTLTPKNNSRESTGTCGMCVCDAKSCRDDCST